MEKLKIFVVDDEKNVLNIIKELLQDDYNITTETSSLKAAEAVENCNGKVVKYIGDEVMATFTNVNDAQNLLGRVSEIEKSLEKGTGFPTKVKIAIDFGLVYELNFKDHPVSDPQGTPVDRCARIAKFGIEGEVLSSSSFVEKTPTLKWEKVGTIELKGLGKQDIYQLGHVTVSLEEKVKVVKDEYKRILKERDKLKLENSKLRENNIQLQDQITQLGQEPNPHAIISNEDSSILDIISSEIRLLSKLIYDASDYSPSSYARFIFLYKTCKGSEEYKKFEGKFIDELIESNIVLKNTEGYYQLNISHPRNKKILNVLKKIEIKLNNYLKVHKPDPTDLFEWSLSDSEFWKKYLHFNVYSWDR